MVPSSDGRSLGRVELTSLLAMSMALTALGIDLMLPVFGDIRADFGLAPDSTAVAGIVTAYFFGLAGGQLLYGPLADRYGRRPTLFASYLLYAVGALASTFAPSLATIYVARVLWGVGAAGPRVITLAVIRDSYEGDRMSRAMSFVFAVFIIVPVAAPTLGAVIAEFAHWRWVFGACVIAVAVMLVWVQRLPETLKPEHRMELRFDRLAAAARFVVSERRTVAYTLAMTSLYGVFTSYLASSEIIFGETFDQADAFPLIFGGLAALMGGAMLVNSKVVGILGTRRLAHAVLLGYLAASAAIVVLAVLTGGRPPLWAFLVALALMLISHALLIPNLNTIAMGPVAPVAGTASSIIGSVQISVGAFLGSLLDRSFDGTILPLSIGFLGYGVLALALVLWGEGGRLFQPFHDPAAEPAVVDA